MIRQILLGWGFLFARPEKFTARIKSWLEDIDPAGVDYPAIGDDTEEA